MVVDIDGPTRQNGVSKLERSQIRTAPGAIDREEAEQGRRQIPEMRKSMCHALIRLLGCRIHGELRFGLIRFPEGLAFIRAIYGTR